MPKTKIGKISFWLVVTGFVLMYMQYWIAMASGLSIPPVIGILPLGVIVICGIASIMSIVRYRDRAILLFLSSLLGILGVLFIIGEFVFPH